MFLANFSLDNFSIELCPKAADVAVIFVGTLSSEGADRRSLSLDDGGPKNNQGSNSMIKISVR